MKIQPKIVCNISRGDLNGTEVLHCTLHCCEYTNTSQCEQDAVPSCMPWLWRCPKHDTQQVGSISNAVRAGFAVCSGQGCVQCKCNVRLSPAGGTATAAWRAADSSGVGTWLSPKGTWSATELHERSLLLTNNSSNACLEIAGPGVTSNETISCRSQLQLFIHDAGAAVLAVGHNEQEQVVMYLWRHIAGTPTQQHQCNPWLQLPALPLSHISSQGMQQAAAASSTHAVFVQQQFGGLQLYVAQTVTHAAGAVLLCVLQQPVHDVCCGTTRQPQHSMTTASRWQSMLISLPGVTERNSLQQILEPEHQQQQTWKLTGQVELTDVPATTPAGSAAVTAAAVKELLTKSSRAIASVKLSWHPQGSHLAIAVSACEGGSWVLLCRQGSTEVQECCWNHLMDKKTTSLLHHGPCHISSMAWLSPDRDVLGVIDTHGRLCLLSGGAFERLQLVDTAGMTITFKPVIQLHFSMLLAATSGSQTTAAALTQHFQLATVPTEAQTSAEGMGGLNKLAIWNGAQLLVCSLYPGVDPSQRRINQTVNSRTLFLYGTTSALRLATHHKHHQPEPEEKGMKLGVRQLQAVGGDTAANALIPGRPTTVSPKASSEGADVSIPTEGVSVVLSPLTNSQRYTLHQQHEDKAADTTTVTSTNSQQQAGQKLASLPQLLCDGDAAFVAGRWQECDTVYRQGLPLTAGHIMSVLFCQYRVQEALALLRQLLADTLQAVAAQQVAEHSASATGGSVINAAAGGAIGHTAAAAAAAEALSTVDVPVLQPLQVLDLGMQLAAALSGVTADVLLAAVSGSAGRDAAAPGPGAATGANVPCIFPTPLHWSNWVKRHTSEQGGIYDPCIWQLTAGMAVELVPGSVLAALSKQVKRNQLSSSKLMLQQSARHAVARAAGLLLLSEVLAAEAEGVPLPHDLPHLLAEAIANTPLLTDAAATDSAGASAAVEVAAGCVGMWQQAAVLAVTCGAILQRVQLQAHMTELSDEAARFALWRQLATHQLAPVPVLAQQAAAVTATAASLWPADYPSLSQFTSKVLGLLCNCLALRVLAVSVLPLSNQATTHSWSNLQQAVVQLLLTQALPAAMPSAVAAWQASLGSAAADQLDTLSHSTAGDKETHHKAYTAAARAFWGNSGVRQLIQVLAALCLENELGPKPFGARLATAGAPLTAEAWATHLHQHLVEAGVADEPGQQQQLSAGTVPSPAELAELSCQCDLLALSSAVLVVAQVALGLSSTDLVHRIKQQWNKMAADAAMPSSSRVQLPGQSRSQAHQIEEEFSPDEALTFISNIAWLMRCREKVAAGEPGNVAGWVVCLAAADGLHKQQNVQQGLLTALAAANCQVTQQDLQQLHDVLSGCCGGVLPRTVDQIKKLKVVNLSDNRHQQHHNKRVEFLQELQATACARSGLRASGLLATSASGWLQGAVEITVKRGHGYLQSFRQAVPGLQDCLIHPLADGPEPSATSAYLALTALLLGSSASSSGSKAGGPPQLNAAAAAAGAPGVEVSAAQGNKKLAADDEVMTPSIWIDVFADGDEDSAVATPAAADHAAASLHAAAAAWQQEHIAVLQDQHLMQDVRQALGSTRQWSIGSFFAGLGSPRPGRLSSMQSMNPSDFNDFLLPSNSFSAAQQPYPPASASPEASAARSSRLSGAAADLRLSSTSQTATGAPRQLLSPKHITSPKRSLHQWNNPLATLELPSLESFYGVYSPTGSAFCESAPVSPGKSLTAGFVLLPPHSQSLHGYVSPTASQPSQLQRVVSAAAGSSAPGSLSSSRLASPRSPSSSLPPEGALSAAGQLSDSTSFMQRFSPLQHYQSLRQQRLLTSQSSRVFRARSLTRAHSGETWERRSSIGGAIEAIAQRPPAQTPGDLPAVATWGSVEPSGLLQTHLSEGSEMTGYDSPVAGTTASPALPAAASSTTASEVPVSAAPSQIAGHEVLPSMDSSVLLTPSSACDPSRVDMLEHVGEGPLKQETLPASSRAPLAVNNSSRHSEDAQATASAEPVSQQSQQQGQSTQPAPISTAAKARIAHTNKVTRGPVDYSCSSPRAAPLSISPRTGPAGYSGSPRAVKVIRNTSSPTAASNHSPAGSPRATRQQTQQSHKGLQLRSSLPGHPVTKPTGQVAHQTLREAQQQPHTRSSIADEKEPVPSSSSSASPGKRGTGYAAHAAHSKSRHVRPVGEAVEQYGGFLERQMQIHHAAVWCRDSSSSGSTTKQLPLRKRWLLRLRRACRWPASECDSSQPGLVRIMAGPISEGIEGAAESLAALAVSQCSSITPRAAVDVSTAQTEGPETTAATEAAVVEPSADVTCRNSGSLEPRVDESNPEHASALQQQHLDDLLKAPEFISVLTRGLSPVQESSYVGSSGPTPESQLGVQPEASPALSVQRSFSMVELHDGVASSPTAEATAAKSGRLRASAGDVTSLLRSQPAELSQYSSSGCVSSGGVTVQQQQQHCLATHSQLKVTSAGPLEHGALAVEAAMPLPSSLQVSGAARVHIPALAAAHGLTTYTPLELGISSHTTTAGPIPVAEGVDSNVSDSMQGSPGSCGSTSWAAAQLLQHQQHQQHQQEAPAQRQLAGLQREVGGSSRRRASLENIPSMMERVGQLMASLQTRAVATSDLDMSAGDLSSNQSDTPLDQAAAAAAEQYLNALAHGAGVDASSNAATAAVEELSELDLSEFMASYSPAGTSRRISRTASTAGVAGGNDLIPRHPSGGAGHSQRLLAAAAAVGAMAHNPLHGAGAERPTDRNSYSPQAASNALGLEGFLVDSGVFSGPGTRATSRQVSAHNTPHQRRSTAEGAAAQISLLAAVTKVLGATDAAEPAESAAATISSSPGAVDPSAVGSQHARSPASSQKAIPLHGPSRLSLQTTAATQSQDTVQQASKGSRQPMQQQQQVQPLVVQGPMIATQPATQPAALHVDSMHQSHVQMRTTANAVESAAASQVALQEMQEQQLAAEPADLVAAVQSVHSGTKQQEQHTELAQQQQGPKEPKEKGSLKRMLFGRLGKSQDGGSKGMLEAASITGEQHARVQHSLTGGQLAPEQPQQTASPPKWGFFSIFGRTSHSGSRGPSESGSPLHQRQLDLQAAAQKLQQRDSPAVGKLSPKMFAMFQRSSSDDALRGQRKAGQQDEAPVAAAAGAAGDVGSEFGDVSMICQVASCPVSPLHDSTGAGDPVSCNISLNGGVLQQQQQQGVVHRAANKGVPLEMPVSDPAPAPAHTMGSSTLVATDIRCQQPTQQAQQQQVLQQAGTACINPPVPPLLAAEAPAAAAAVVAPGSPVVQVLANSMQRIATALEEFLCDHSPASRTAPGTAKSKAVGSSPLRPTSAVQEEQPAVGWSATTRLQRRSAPVGQQMATTWSPAALAAKARMLRSTAASKAPSTHVQQQVHQHRAAPVQVETKSADEAEPTAAAAAASGTAAAVAQEPGELCSKLTGWLHPGQFERGHTQSPIVQQQRATNHPQQQQQQEQVAEPLADGHTPASEGLLRSVGDSARSPAGINSLDSFLLLASRAVGVDFLLHSLQPNNAVAPARQHHMPQDEQQPQHGELGTSHRVHLQAAVTINQPAEPAAASASAHISPVKGSSDLSSSPLSRRSWQHNVSVTPTGQQHPRLWRPANLRIHRTRVSTPIAAPVSPSCAEVAASIPQPLDPNADHTSGFSRFCGVSAAALPVGSTPGRMPVPSLGARHPLCAKADSATTASAGAAKCLVAAADVKLIHRGMERSIRLLRPTHLQEELQGLHRGPHQQQHQSSGLMQRPTQPQGYGPGAAGASADDSCFQHSRPAALATYHSHEPDLASGPKLVRFPVAAVEVNLLQPPVLQQVRTLASHLHFPDQQAGEPRLQTVGGASAQQLQRLWSNPPLVQQQQQPEQHQRVRAPWEVAGRSQGTTSPLPEGALTAGIRAARLLNTLLEPTGQPSATQAGVAAAEQQPPLPLQPAQQHVSTMENQVIGSPTVPADSGTVPADLQPPSSSMPAAAPQPAWTATQHQLHRNPARSPRKNVGLHKKWVTLQQLKARNRSRKPLSGTAGRQGVQQQQQHRTAESSSPADRLVEQLQQLMQQPAVAGAADDVQQATYMQMDSCHRRYLDAAAATALQQANPHPQSTPAQQQLQHHHQQQQWNGSPKLEDSISFSKLEAGASGLEVALRPPVNTAAVQTKDSSRRQQEEEEQPLLLPRMLSRAPLVDAEVQAGPLLQQQQYQQLGVAAGDPTTAALVAEVQKLVQLHRQPSAGTVAPEPPGAGQEGDPVPGQTKQYRPCALQPQQPMSPASIVALAAAAGAGAAAAVHSASPSSAVAAAATGQASAAASLPALAAADQQPMQDKSVTELARLILGAFESAGGVITPDRNALGSLSHKDSTVATAPASPYDWQQQQQQQLELLPNPLAGPAAPKYLSVVEFTPPCLENSTADLQQDEVQQHDQQQHADQQPHTQQQYTLMSFSTDAQPHHGCCFAACPQRIPSPSFKGSPTITRKISPPKGWHRPQMQDTTSNSRRSEFKQAQVTVTTSSRKVSGSAGKRSSHKQQRSSSKRVGADTRSHSHHHHHHSDRHQQGSTTASHQQQQQDPWGVPGVGVTSSIGVMTPPISRKTSSKLQELRQSRLSVLQQQQQQPQQQGSSDWARQQTRQLAHLWQQWNSLQGQQHRDQQHQLHSQQQHADENSDPHGAQYATGISGNQQVKAGQQQQQLGGNCGTSSAAISSGADAPPSIYMAERYTEPDNAAAVAATETAQALAPDGAINVAPDAAAVSATTAGQDVGAREPVQQPFSQERLQVEAAYARAAAARAAAKAAAQRAAAARSQRLRAELTDLSKMLSEVDGLAAQMEAEAAEAAAVIQQYIVA